MGFKKEGLPVPQTAPVVEAPVTPAKVEGTPFTKTPVISQKRDYSSDDKKVHGQVRMHGIIAGYKVASAIAPTLANTSASIKDELHKLAAEVAAKIEAYSFSGE